MGTASVTPPAPETAPLSQFQRILSTFIAPGKTFSDLRRSASWWAPYLLIVVVSFAFVFTMERQIGFDQLTKNAIAQSSRAEQFEKLPPDQQAQQLQLASKITRYISYAAPAISLVIFLIIAAVLMGTFNLALGASVPFKVAFAIIIYASLPGVISGILAIVSMFAGIDPSGFNAQNPVASNPAYFMDPATTSKFLYGIASALDVFVIWTIILVGIGFAANSKVKRSPAIGVVAGLYLVYKVAAAGLSSLS